MRKVQYMDDETCWFWMGARSKSGDGYGFFNYKGKNRMAHRLMYVWWIGPIPTGLQLDHLCRNMGCVNPSHLEPVTLYENNVVRGKGLAAQNAVKAHCKRGHPLSGDNLMINANGARVCRVCSRAAARAWKEKAGYHSDGKSHYYDNKQPGWK